MIDEIFDENITEILDIYRGLVKAYTSNDVKLFNQINDEYDIGIKDFKDIPLIETRNGIDLGSFNSVQLSYFKNSCHSYNILDMDKRFDKHVLKDSGPHIKAYSLVIYNVLNALMFYGDFEEALSHVYLNMDKDIALDFLFKSGILLDVGDGEVEITKFGEFRLRGLSWIKFYSYTLNHFDFDDFEQYMVNNDSGSVITNSLNYLDENLKLALKQKDFNRLYDVFSSKAIIHVYQKEFDEALNEELKLYILKSNPVFLDKEDLDDYEVFEFPNIDNIKSLRVVSDSVNFKKDFDNAWEDIGLDEFLVSKKIAFDYLNRALGGANISYLSDKFADKYF